MNWLKLKNRIMLRLMGSRTLAMLTNNSSYIRKLNALRDHEGKPVEEAVLNFAGWSRTKTGVRYDKNDSNQSFPPTFSKCFGLFRPGKLTNDTGLGLEWYKQYPMLVHTTTEGSFIRPKADIERFLTKKYGRQWKIVLPRDEAIRSSLMPSTR